MDETKEEGEGGEIYYHIVQVHDFFFNWGEGRRCRPILLVLTSFLTHDLE